MIPSEVDTYKEIYGPGSEKGTTKISLKRCWFENNFKTYSQDRVVLKKKKKEKGEEDIRSYGGKDTINTRSKRPEVLKMQLNTQKRRLGKHY